MSASRIGILASYPRSGNTWLRAFILALSLGPEAFRAAWADLDSYMPSDIAPQLYARAGIEYATLGASGILERRGEMLRFVQRELPNTILKTHTLFATIRGRPCFEPALLGPAVYILRNPLEVAPSLAGLIGTDIAGAIAVMNAPLHCRYRAGGIPDLWGTWSENVASWTSLKSVSVLTLRYEDLAQRPEQVLEQVARHFQFRAGPDRIAAALEITRLDRLMALETDGTFRNPSVIQRERGGQFFGQGVSRDFTEKLTPDQAAAILRAQGPLMARFGYLDARTLDFARLTRRDIPGL